MEKIKLGETILDQECTLDLYRAAGDSPKGCVIVFPGGGYCMTAMHEANPVAERFVEMGFHAAVCWYRVKPVHYPVPLEDARAAVRYVRSHAAELGVKPDKIAVLGFSAGAHLAAMVAHMPGGEDAKVNASILCYPVLDPTAGGERAHIWSYYNLFGNELPAGEYEAFTWTKQVTKDTPPAFLWHTAADDTVPCENSLKYAMALKQAGIPFALHIYPNGGHGLSMGNRPGLEHQYPALESWPELAATWLREMEF